MAAPRPKRDSSVLIADPQIPISPPGDTRTIARKIAPITA